MVLGMFRSSFTDFGPEKDYLPTSAQAVLTVHYWTLFHLCYCTKRVLVFPSCQLCYMFSKTPNGTPRPTESQDLRTGRPPTEAQNPQPPKSARESAQRGAGQKRGARGSAWESARPPCSQKRHRRTSTFPSTSPSTPFLAGTSPSTLPSTFGGLGVLRFCRGPPRSQPKTPPQQKKKNPKTPKSSRLD